MAMLKEYTIASVNISRLNTEVIDSALVINFDGLCYDDDKLKILGDSVTDVAALDALIIAHDHTPTVVIPDVTARQIREALIMSGVTMQQIVDSLNTLPEPDKSIALVQWEFSNMFERNRPLVTSVGVMLGWTEQQLDDLWALAGSL